MRVGILDQSPVRSGGTPADAVHETLELARAADRWGFHRYWLAEHHSTPGLAGASPEVLIAQVAAVKWPAENFKTFPKPADSVRIVASCK